MPNGCMPLVLSFLAPMFSLFGKKRMLFKRDMIVNEDTKRVSHPHQIRHPIMRWAMTSSDDEIMMIHHSFAKKKLNSERSLDQGRPWHFAKHFIRDFCILVAIQSSSVNGERSSPIVCQVIAGDFFLCILAN